MRNHNNLFEILCDLFLAVKPKIIAHSRDVNLRNGESFTISCTASGHPAPSVGWLIPGSTIFLASSMTTLSANTTATYQIRNVSKKTLNICQKHFLFYALT